MDMLMDEIVKYLKSQFYYLNSQRFLMYNNMLLLFFQSLKFPYFCFSLRGLFCEGISQTENQDVKMTNPAGCAQG